VALLVLRQTNNRKVVGSRPTKVVCITVLTGNRLGWNVRCDRRPLRPILPSCRKLEFRLSALRDSDLAWINGKSGRQSYADAFQRCILSGAVYHFIFSHFYFFFRVHLFHFMLVFMFMASFFHRFISSLSTSYHSSRFSLHLTACQQFSHRDHSLRYFFIVFRCLRTPRSPDWIKPRFV